MGIYDGVHCAISFSLYPSENVSSGAVFDAVGVADSVGVVVEETETEVDGVTVNEGDGVGIKKRRHGH